MEILPGVHRIQCPYGHRNVYIYLLTGEKNLLVDTAVADSPASSIFPYLSKTGMSDSDLDYVIITHPDTDHQGGNDAIRKRFPGALFLAHELDASLIEDTDALIEQRQDYTHYGFPMSPEARERVQRLCRSQVRMDILLQGDESLRLGSEWTVQVLHVPGHSRGHLAIYDAKHQLAIISDAVLGNGIPDAAGVNELPPTYRYVNSYLQTIQLLVSIPINILLTAHFPILRGGEVKAFFDLSRDFCLTVEHLVQETVTQCREPVGLPALIESLSSRLGNWPDRRKPMLAWSFLGHLEKLEGEGIVRRVEGEETVRWVKT